MWLFAIFLLPLCSETLINMALGQEYSNEPTEIINETLRPDMLNFPRSNGFISGNYLSRPASVWGCDKYSSAVYGVTKRAITFADEVTIYLQSGKNDLQESSNVTSSQAARISKLNVLRKGVDFYRDLALVVKVLWLDFENAMSMLADKLSTALEVQISRLTATKTPTT